MGLQSTSKKYFHSLIVTPLDYDTQKVIYKLVCMSSLTVLYSYYAILVS